MWTPFHPMQESSILCTKWFAHQANAAGAFIVHQANVAGAFIVYQGNVVKQLWDPWKNDREFIGDGVKCASMKECFWIFNHASLKYVSKIRVHCWISPTPLAQLRYWPICEITQPKTMIARHRDSHYKSKTLQWRHNERDDVSNNQPHDCLPRRLFRCWSKETSKLRVTGPCEGNSPVTGEFPAQRASNTENVSIWWRHQMVGRPNSRRPSHLFTWNSCPNRFRILFPIGIPILIKLHFYI